MEFWKNYFLITEAIVCEPPQHTWFTVNPPLMKKSTGTGRLLKLAELSVESALPSCPLLPAPHIYSSPLSVKSLFLLQYKRTYPVCPSPVDSCCIFLSKFIYLGAARSHLLPWPNAPSFPYPQVKTWPLSSSAAAKLSPVSMSTILKRIRDLMRNFVY